MIIVILSTLIALLVPIPLAVNAWVASERRWTDRFWHGCSSQYHWDRAAAERMGAMLDAPGSLHSRLANIQSPPSGACDAGDEISPFLEQWASEMVAAATSMWTPEPRSGIVRLADD